MLLMVLDNWCIDLWLDLRSHSITSPVALWQKTHLHHIKSHEIFKQMKLSNLYMLFIIILNINYTFKGEM